MAYFYGAVLGSRSETSRLGTRQSGIRTIIQSASIGLRAQIMVDEYGNDVVQVWLTKGRSGYKVKLLGTYTEEDFDRTSKSIFD